MTVTSKPGLIRLHILSAARRARGDEPIVFATAWTFTARQMRALYRAMRSDYLLSPEHARNLIVRAALAFAPLELPS